MSCNMCVGSPHGTTATVLPCRVLIHAITVVHSCHYRRVWLFCQVQVIRRNASQNANAIEAGMAEDASRARQYTRAQGPSCIHLIYKNALLERNSHPTWVLEAASSDR